MLHQAIGLNTSSTRSPSKEQSMRLNIDTYIIINLLDIIAGALRSSASLTTSTWDCTTSYSKKERKLRRRKWKSLQEATMTKKNYSPSMTRTAMASSAWKSSRTCRKTKSKTPNCVAFGRESLHIGMDINSVNSQKNTLNSRQT